MASWDDISVLVEESPPASDLSDDAIHTVESKRLKTTIDWDAISIPVKEPRSQPLDFEPERLPREAILEQEPEPEWVGKTGRYIGERLPVVGTIAQGVKTLQVANAKKRIETGKPEPEDYGIYAQYLYEQDEAQRRTMGEEIIEGLSQMPRYMGEMALAGPVGRAAGGLAGRAVGGALPKLATKGVTAAATTAGLIAASPQRVFESATRRQLQYDESLLEAIPKAVLDVGPELFTEAYGGKLLNRIANKLPGATRFRKAQEVVAAAWLKKFPNRTMNDLLTKLANQASWNGIVGELGEEWQADAIKGAIGQLTGIKGLDYATRGDLFAGLRGIFTGDEEDLKRGERGWYQQKVELGVIGAMGTGQVALGALGGMVPKKPQAADVPAQRFSAGTLNEARAKAREALGDDAVMEKPIRVRKPGEKGATFIIKARPSETAYAAANAVAEGELVEEGEAAPITEIAPSVPPEIEGQVIPSDEAAALAEAERLAAIEAGTTPSVTTGQEVPGTTATTPSEWTEEDIERAVMEMNEAAAPAAAQEIPETVAVGTIQPSPTATPIKITKQMEADLKSRGLAQAEINELTPQAAWDIVNERNDDRTIRQAVASRNEPMTIVAGGQRFQTVGSDYGEMGKLLVGDTLYTSSIVLEDGSTIDSSLIDQILDPEGNVVYSRPERKPQPEISALKGAAPLKSAKGGRTTISSARIPVAVSQSRKEPEHAIETWEKQVRSVTKHPRISPQREAAEAGGGYQPEKGGTIEEEVKPSRKLAEPVARAVRVAQRVLAKMPQTDEQAMRDVTRRIAAKHGASADAVWDVVRPDVIVPGETKKSFDKDFDTAFDTAARNIGLRDKATTEDLREVLPQYTKTEFDTGILNLRRAGKVSLSIVEGRGGASENERASWIEIEGNQYGLVTRIKHPSDKPTKSFREIISSASKKASAITHEKEIAAPATTPEKPVRPSPVAELLKEKVPTIAIGEKKGKPPTAVPRETKKITAATIHEPELFGLSDAEIDTLIKSAEVKQIAGDWYIDIGGNEFAPKMDRDEALASVLDELRDSKLKDFIYPRQIADLLGAPPKKSYRLSEDDVKKLANEAEINLIQDNWVVSILGNEFTPRLDRESALQAVRKELKDYDPKNYVHPEGITEILEAAKRKKIPYEEPDIATAATTAAAPTLAERAAQAEAKAKEDLRDAVRYSRGISPVNVFVDPVLWQKFAKATASLIHAKVLTFRAYVQRIKEAYQAEGINEIPEAIQSRLVETWNTVRAKMPNGESLLDEATPDALAEALKTPSPTAEKIVKVAPEEPPPETPPKTAAEVEGGLPEPTATKHAHMDVRRTALKLPPRLETDPVGHTFPELVDEANAASNIEIDNLISGLAIAPRTINDRENALMLRRLVEYDNAYRDGLKALLEAQKSGDNNTAAEKERELRTIVDSTKIIADALDAAGTSAGRSLNARKMLMNRQFEAVRMIEEYRVTHKGEMPSAEKQAELSAMANEIKTAQEEVDNAEQNAQIDEDIEEQVAIAEKKKKTFQRTKEGKAARASFKNVMAKWARDNQISAKLPAAKTGDESHKELVRAARKSGVVSLNDLIQSIKRSGFNPAAVDAMKDKLNTAWKATITEAVMPKPTATFDRTNANDVSSFARELEKYFVEQGIHEREAVVTAVHAELKKVVPGITNRETRDAMSRYGKVSIPSQEETDKIIRNINAQMQKVSQLEDIQSGKGALATGYQRDKPSDALRHLIKEVNEAKKQAEEKGTIPVDTQRRLATARDAAKRAILNSILDIGEEISSGKRIINKNSVDITDNEIDALRKLRDSLRSIHRELFPLRERKPEYVKEAEELAKREIAAEKKADEAERNVRELELESKKKPDDKPTSERLESARRRRDAANAERKRLLRERMKWEKAEITEEQETEKYSAQAAKRYETLAAKWLARAARGDFTPPQKHERKLTSIGQEARLKLEKAKAKYLAEKEKWRLANRTVTEKLAAAVGEAWQMRRDLMTTGEASVVARQGLMLWLTRPIEAMFATANFGKVLVASNPGDALFKIRDDLLNDQYGELRKKAKVPFTTQGESKTQMEEQITSNWSEKIPLVGRLITRFRYAGDAFLDISRAKMFDLMAGSMGADPNTLTSAEALVLGSAAGVFTGKGDMKAAMAHANWLNKVFFSFPFTLSRFQMVLGQPAWKGTVRTRKAVGMVYLRAAVNGTILYFLLKAALSAMTGDDDELTIETDKTSSDFGKLKIGKVRIDPFAGLQQVVVLFSRLIEQRTTKHGVSVPLGVGFKADDTKDVLKKFLFSKAHPNVNAIIDHLPELQGRRGKDYAGQPLPLLKEHIPTSYEGLKTLGGAFIPMSYPDMVDAANELGYPLGLATFGLAFSGMGLGTYGASSEETKAAVTKMAIDAMMSEDKTKATRGPMKGKKKSQYTGEHLERAKMEDEVIKSARTKLLDIAPTRKEQVRLLKEYWKVEYGGIIDKRTGRLKDAYLAALRRLPAKS